MKRHIKQLLLAKNQAKIGVILALLFLIFSCGREGVPGKGRTIFVRTQGADLPVYLHGNEDSRVVILVLHGGPGGNGSEYRSGTYAKMLEDKYVMAYLDQRGQGAAKKVNSGYKVTMQTMIDDVAAVVKVLKHELGNDFKVYLFGHSWGGTLGTGFLLFGNNQEHIQGWIESDGAHDIPELNKEAIPMFIQIGEEEIAKDKNVDRWTEIVKWAEGVDVENITVDESGKINEYGYEAEALLDDIGEQDNGGIKYRLLYNPVDPIVSLMSGNATSQALLDDGIESLSYTAQLKKITIPTLLLWGKYDFVVPPALGLSAQKILGSTDITFTLFEHSGHSPMNTEAVIFAESIIQFIERTK